MKPIMSICIPTYNRAEILDKNIKRIIDQDEFKSGKVELVISDNCSEDDTQKICMKYAEKYENFIYHRNEKNIRDENFPNVLKYGNGTYRKLSNDTIRYEDGALKYFVDVLEKPEVKKNHPVVFYRGDKKNCSDEILESPDDFMNCLSFNITWIGGLGIWEEDTEYLDESIPDCATHLWQVPFLLNCLSRHNGSYVIHKILSSISYSSSHKFHTREFYEIFYTNYLTHINNFVEKKILNKETYDYLRKDLLYHFLTYWMINMDLAPEKLLFDPDEERLTEMIMKQYGSEPYFQNYLKFYHRQKIRLGLLHVLSVIYHWIKRN
ncbi:MAG: glycosyltransferase [Lachnospiraceae bacterium]|jgi:abequosyltransferase|nr:glycosyltransferase [Lachnospiraceae bacterium]MEE3460920.1 glycosyltransferase [Lachnospiraceae bacterium]